MMNAMLNHIADHLQFLALLTIRLSARKIANGDVHSFSSSQTHSSDQDSEDRNSFDNDSESIFVEEDASNEKDEYEFLAEAPPDLE
jgi:hypothetical protein